MLGQHEKQLVAILHLTDRRQRVAGGDRAGEVVHRKAVAGKALGLREHLDLRGLTPLHDDAGKAADRRQQRRQLELREVAQGDRARGAVALALRYQRIGDDREHRRVHPPDVVGGACRQ